MGPFCKGSSHFLESTTFLSLPLLSSSRALPNNSKCSRSPPWGGSTFFKGSGLPWEKRDLMTASARIRVIPLPRSKGARRNPLPWKPSSRTKESSPWKIPISSLSPGFRYRAKGMPWARPFLARSKSCWGELFSGECNGGQFTIGNEFPLLIGDLDFPKLCGPSLVDYGSLGIDIAL